MFTVSRSVDNILRNTCKQMSSLLSKTNSNLWYSHSFHYKRRSFSRNSMKTSFEIKLFLLGFNTKFLESFCVAMDSFIIYLSVNLVLLKDKGMVFWVIFEMRLASQKSMQFSLQFSTSFASLVILGFFF